MLENPQSIEKSFDFKPYNGTIANLAPFKFLVEKAEHYMTLLGIRLDVTSNGTLTMKHSKVNTMRNF